MIKKIIELIRKQHGRKLSLNEDVYYLKIKDAMICLYLDEEEKTLKLDVEALGEDKTYVCFNEEISLEDLVDSGIM